MALDVYFASDLASSIVSSVTLALDTAAACGEINTDFLRGVLALAKAQALQYGLSWPALAAEVQAAIGDPVVSGANGNHALLLELAMVERPRRIGP